MKTRSKTPLFLMELIIMLLVFSISAAVCLQVFSGAKKISEESRKLDAAVIQAQTIAECWKASHGDLKETTEMMNVIPAETGFKVYDEESLSIFRIVRFRGVDSLRIRVVWYERYGKRRYYRVLYLGRSWR